MNRSVRRIAAKGENSKFDRALAQVWKKNPGRVPMTEEQLARECRVSRVRVNLITRLAFAKLSAGLVEAGVYLPELHGVSQAAERSDVTHFKLAA